MDTAILKQRRVDDLEVLIRGWYAGEHSQGWDYWVEVIAWCKGLGVTIKKSSYATQQAIKTELEPLYDLWCDKYLGKSKGKGVGPGIETSGAHA